MKKTYLLTRNRIATIFLAVLCSMTGIAANAQLCFPTWNYTTTNSNRYARGFDIARDSDGSIYVAGTFDNTADFPATCPVTVTGSTPVSAFIAKFNRCGDLLWVNYDYGSGTSEGMTLVVDTTGSSVFLAGHSVNDHNFFSTAATPCSAPVPALGFTSTCYYVAQFNKSTGAFIDAHTPAVTPGYINYRINSMAMNKNAAGVYELYFTGSARTGTNVRVLLSRSDYAGTYTTVWTRFALNASTTISRGYDIIYNTMQGDISVTGEYEKQLPFTSSAGPISVSTLAIQDGFICTFDPATGDASPTLFRTTGAASGQRASGRALAVDAAGDVYYSGMYTGGLASTYGFTALGGLFGVMRTYVLRTSGTTAVWVNNLTCAANGQNEAWGVSFNGTQCVVSGTFYGGALNFPLGSTGGYVGGGTEQRTYLCTYDRTTGTMISGNVTESTVPGSQHQARRIVADDSYTYTTGTYTHFLDYGTGTPISGPLTSIPAIYENMMILRNSTAAFNPYAKPSGNGNEGPLEETAASEILSVYPNPATDAVTVRLGDDLELPAALLISDAQGRTVAAQTLLSHTTALDVSRFPAGVYTIMISSGKKEYRTKVVKP